MTDYNYEEQKEIGARIRHRIEQLGFTRLDVATQSKMTPKTLRNIINGNAFPKSQEVIRLSHTLKTSPNFILSGSDTFEPLEPLSELEQEQQKRANMMKIASLVLLLDKTDSDSIERIVRSMLSTKLTAKEFKAAEDNAELMYSMISSPEFLKVLKVEKDIFDKRKGTPPKKAQ
jgi:transcriptional regulator with XRE-family HTH domain